MAYEITLYITPTCFNLTSEGFAEKRDARVFDDKDEAMEVFDAIDEAFLVRDGFGGFNTSSVVLTEYSVDAEEEVTSSIVAEKQVTVDTVAA